MIYGSGGDWFVVVLAFVLLVEQVLCAIHFECVVGLATILGRLVAIIVTGDFLVSLRANCTRL